jgi:hypothetical protein
MSNSPLNPSQYRNPSMDQRVLMYRFNSQWNSAKVYTPQLRLNLGTDAPSKRRQKLAEFNDDFGFDFAIGET